MVVKSATKKKLMDMGVDDAYAHKLAWERKWDGVVVLSPRNILTNLFGAKTWNNQFSALHPPPEKQPNLSQSFPLTTSQLDRLTPTGVEHIEIVNDIYAKIHKLEKKEQVYGHYGVINHTRLFVYTVYEYEIIKGPIGIDHKLQRYKIYRTGYAESLPHKKHQERQEKLFKRYTDQQGRQKQY